MSLKILGAVAIVGLIGCSGGASSVDAGLAPPVTRFATFRERSMVISHLDQPAQPPFAVGSTRAADLLRSSDPSIVSIDDRADLIAHRAGSATIYGSGESRLSVTVAAFSTLEIRPSVVHLTPRATTAIAVFGDGTPVPANVFRWQTTNPDIAAAFGSTIQAGNSTGTATLTLDAGGLRSTVEVTVKSQPEHAHK